VPPELAPSPLMVLADAVRLGHREAVDRLEDGQPATRPQHPGELGERGLLGRQVPRHASNTLAVCCSRITGTSLTGGRLVARAEEQAA